MSDKAIVLARLATVVASNPVQGSLAARLCVACRTLLEVDGAAITIDNLSPHRMTMCSTDDLSGRLEDLQEVLGEGPSQDAYRTGQPVTSILDDEDEDRWPQFTIAARDLLGRQVALFCLPMRPGADVLGVLTLYKRPQGELGEDLETALFLSDAVAVALLREPTMDGELGGVGPWKDRSVIHQATGMVIAQLGLAPDDAMALLKAHAFAQSATLLETATAVVERRLDFGRS